MNKRWFIICIRQTFTRNKSQFSEKWIIDDEFQRTCFTKAVPRAVFMFLLRHYHTDLRIPSWMVHPQLNLNLKFMVLVTQPLLQSLYLLDISNERGRSELKLSFMAIRWLAKGFRGHFPISILPGIILLIWFQKKLKPQKVHKIQKLCWGWYP